MRHFLPVPVMVAAMFLLAVSIRGAEKPRPDQPELHRWQRITYPRISVPEAENEMFTIIVGSGLGDEKQELRFDVLAWGSSADHPPSVLADAQQLTIQLHMPDGKVLAPNNKPAWIGTGNAGALNWSLICSFPWGRNALEEGWFQMTLGDRSYWFEVPYGFTRNPADPLAPRLPERNGPVFAAAMGNLRAADRMVAWDSVEYDVGEIGGGLHLGNEQLSRRLVVRQSNPFDAACRLQLYGVSDLHAPRSSVEINQSNSHRVVGRCVSLAFDESAVSRIDTFKFNRNPVDGRDWGKLVVKIDDQQYEMVMPSSLFKYVHGISDPYHKSLIRASRRF